MLYWVAMFYPRDPGTCGNDCEWKELHCLILPPNELSLRTGVTRKNQRGGYQLLPAYRRALNNEF